MNVHARPQTKLDVVPLTKYIGAEIRGLDLRTKPDDDTVKAIYQAWLDHLVIIFPDQKLSQEDLIRVTGYFGEIGELHRPPKYFPKGYSKILPGIMMISNIRENGEPIGALPDGEMMFHHDMIHAEVPSKGTLLYSVEIPSTRRQHAVRQRLRRLRHARSRRSAMGSKARRRCITTITVRSRRATTRARKPSANACIRCSAPTRTPSARRSTSTV